MQWFRNDDKIVVAISYDFNCMGKKKKKLISYCFLKCQAAEFNRANWLERKKNK